MYDRSRGALPHRVAARAAYQSTASGLLRVAAAKAAHIKRNQRRAKAYNAVNKAIGRKKIARLPCFVCGERNSEAHHPDYSAPLSVVWLCSAHHKQLHKEHRESSR